MEDEYNVLGNFENLNSAHILKSLKEGLPPKLDDSATCPFFSVNGDDSFSEFDKVVSLKKTAKKESISTARRKRASISSVESSTQSSDLLVNENSNRRVTRGSLNKTLNSSFESSGAKKGRGRPRRKNGAENCSTTLAVISDSVDATGIPDDTEQSTSSRGRPRRNPPRNVMRARRQYISGVADRCPTVDIVDLITSPLPPKPKVVYIDSDLENDDCSTSSKSNLNSSFQEDNPEMSVKIVWQGKIEVFTIRKYEKFLITMEELARREKIGVDKIFLNLKSHIITPNDTPASIDYKIVNFIDGRIMQHKIDVNANKKKRDPNLITLKVQSDKWKRPLSIELLKTENFKKLAIKCAEELKMPYQKIKLSFDGETLQYDQTPIDLDLEGGEILEIHLKD